MEEEKNLSTENNTEIVAENDESIKIANDVVVGAGAVVLKNITESGVYIGVPAKKKE